MDEEVLENLNVYCNDLSEVCPSLLARAIVKMRCVDIGYNELTPDQATTLFQTIVGQEDMMLEDIRIEDNNTLSEVDPSLFARAIVKMKKVKFGDASITSEQLVAVESVIREMEGVVIECLEMNGVNVIKDIKRKGGGY